MEPASPAMLPTVLSVPLLIVALLVMETILPILKDNVSFVSLHVPPVMLMDLVQLVLSLSIQCHQMANAFLVKIHSASPAYQQTQIIVQHVCKDTL